jgi:hypothetical protein
MPLLIDLLAGPATGTSDLFHDQVRFRSPYADYAGRDDVGHLVGLIRQALADLRITRRLGSAADTMTQFEARVVTGEEVQGVLVEQRDGDGRLVEAMLTLRPYAGLRAAMRAMQPLLEASPLPGQRTP